MERPVELRFRPTDEELVGYYLENKIAGNDSLVDNIIGDVKICDQEPWHLPALAKMEPENGDTWHFLSRPEPKYPKSQTRKKRETQKMNRSTKEGYWKSTGLDRFIKQNGRVIGTKKTLVFYLRGGQRTNWVMHEYRAASVSPIGRDYVVYKLKYKGDDNPASLSREFGQSSHSFASDSVNFDSSSYIMPEVNNQMQETSPDTLNSFGGSNAKKIDLPYELNVGLMPPESDMEDDKWIDSLTIDPDFQNELQAQPDGYII